MSDGAEEVIETRKVPKASQLKRFFSLESTGTDSLRSPNCTEEDHTDRSENICNYNFALKLSQLFVGVISIGMYSTAILVVPCDQVTNRKGLTESRMTSLMFPNIVFTTFLIITSVIALSYALKQSMSESVVRIFNVIGMVLYFVSANVSGYIWYKYLYKKVPDQDLIPYVMFCGQIVTSLLNAVLYGLDVGFSVKKAWNIR